MLRRLNRGDRAESLASFSASTSIMSYPFFRAVKADGAAGFTTSGVTSCRLGHRFETPGDPPREQGAVGEGTWDGSRLTARVDRLGFYSLFYFETEREVMVS